MKQFIYIDSFEVLRADLPIIAQKVKITGHKKKNAFRAKHQASEAIAKKMDDDALWLECKNKEALRCEAKRLKQLKRRLSKKKAVHR